MENLVILWCIFGYLLMYQYILSSDISKIRINVIYKGTKYYINNKTSKTHPRPQHFSAPLDPVLNTVPGPRKFLNRLCI
jgi:hypothetical protein